MATLVKRNNTLPTFPSMQSLMQDLWNNEGFLTPSFFTRNELQPVNVRETKQGYELEIAAPGFKKEDFKVNTENGMLNISAESTNEKKEETDSYVRQEFSCSSFSRSFTLPENVTEDHINAAYKDGILKIELKKNGKAIPAPKAIKVN